MAVSGPNLPATGADDATVGTVVWANPGNITVADGVFAVASMASQTSHYIKATNFGFNIPSTAIIRGILVQWRISGNAATKENSVKMVQGGSISGTDKSTSALIGSTSTVYRNYGSPTDLWGLTWAPSDINSSTFGAVFSTIQPAADAGIASHCDAVRITVYYDNEAVMKSVPLFRVKPAPFKPGDGTFINNLRGRKVVR